MHKTISAQMVENAEALKEKRLERLDEIEDLLCTISVTDPRFDNLLTERNNLIAVTR